jgi:ABC-type nitrate/sulfonate/bicarbonate transport system ATPase subunit
MSVSIEVKDVKKIYLQTVAKPGWHKLVGKQSKPTKFVALNKLSVNIKAGSFTTIFGPNGSGKSTLFRLIAGLDDPSSGSVAIDGKPVQQARIGFVFQNYRDSMLTWRTAIGNVCLALEAKHVKSADQKKIAMQYLKRVGMAHIADKPFYSLSGGQAQLVAIARAFAYEPDILLMDEPFSALDFQTSMGMMQALTKLWQETKITTLFISHDIDEAVFLADQVMVLTKNPGRLQKMIPVKLPRPRDVSIISDNDFFKIRRQVLKEFEKGSKK